MWRCEALSSTQSTVTRAGVACTLPIAPAFESRGPPSTRDGAERLPSRNSHHCPEGEVHESGMSGPSRPRRAKVGFLGDAILHLGQTISRARQQLEESQCEIRGLISAVT